MVDTKERVSAEIAEAGAPDLAGLMHELVGAGRLRQIHKLKPGVYRFAFDIAGTTRSLVAKRLSPDRAERNRLVAARWLRAAELGRHGPSLIGAVGTSDSRCVWQVYEDLGRYTLEDRCDRQRVEAALDLLARLHARFVRHPLLAECRLWGEDHGISFFRSSVGDALSALRALRPPLFEPYSEKARLRDRLLGRLDDLWAQVESRTALLIRAGGAETLLHGDLWPRNMFVRSHDDELVVRLIDWDHVGVGPISYDLSIFLLRFPLSERAWMVDVYARAAACAGHLPPCNGDLSVLCETAELSRLANRLIWPALAARDGHADWGFSELATVEKWFEALDVRVPE